MSDTVKGYKTVQGFVYAGPYERDAAGKKVRDFYISTPTVSKEDEVIPDTPVRVTVWPTHADVDIAVGDYILANGTYEIFKQQGDTGDWVYKHSCSANKFMNQGSGLGNQQPRGSVVPSEKKKRPVPSLDLD